MKWDRNKLFTQSMPNCLNIKRNVYKIKKEDRISFTNTYEYLYLRLQILIYTNAYTHIYKHKRLSFPFICRYTHPGIKRKIAKIVQIYISLRSGSLLNEINVRDKK